MQSTAGKTGWTKKYQHWLTLASAAINSLKFNSQALWPAVPTALGLLDSNCYSSHQGQPPAPQVNKTKEAKRPPPFHQGLSLQIQGRVRGSLGKFTAGWQRITRSFPASSPFLLRREKERKSLIYVGFPSPLPSKVYNHTDQGKDTIAEITDAYCLSLGEEKAHVNQPP